MSAKQKLHRVCEICGTRERHENEKLFFARFPLHVERCKEWLRVVGKQDLVYLPIEKLHQLRYVCEKHFLKRDFTKNGRLLKKRAIPKLFLTGTPLNEDCFAEFPLHIAKDPVAPSNTPSTLVTLENKKRDAYDIPLTSLQEDTESKTIEKLNKISKIEMQDPAMPSTSGIQSSMAVSIKANPKKVIVAVNPQNPVMPSTSNSQAVATPSIIAKRRKVLSEVNTPNSDPVMPSTSNTQAVATPSNIAKRRKVLSEVNTPNPVKPSTSSQQTLDTSITQSSLRSKLEQKKTSKIGLQDLNCTEKNLLKELEKAKSTIRSLKKNAKMIEKIQSPVLMEIVDMALKNQKRKPRGRRWTTKYKISLLAILKRSPKAYRYLKHLMPLPTENTLQNILKKVPMEPGLSKQALQYLKKQGKNDLNKHCCLLFDEVALKPRLIYNCATDKVEGYTDMGSGDRTEELADHALVFMLQGLRKKYKQPIAFYFIKGTVSSPKLATLILEIINAIHETGHNVMATVCDQGPTNMGALKILKDLTVHNPVQREKDNFFKVKDKMVYIIYDVPHLIKSIRNNFLNYGTMTMEGKTAKWDHLLKVEDMNKNLLYLSKVSEVHVQPKYRAKMKVKYAAQLLSNTVAAVLKLLALAENDPIEANKIKETAEIVQNVDKLFDYTNGPSGPDDIKKGLRQNVSSKTDHIEVWANFRKKLQTVTFVKQQTGTRAKNVRCIQGYMTTLCSLRDIWTDCQRLGFKYLNLRQLNQDSLENLFGILRQHSPTNKNPTVSAFIAGLKTTVVSKMTAPHSRGSNCQQDTSTLLTDFHDIVFGNETSTDERNKQENEKENVPLENMEVEDSYVLSIPEILEEVEEAEENLANIEMQAIVYVSGYIVHSIFKKHECVKCSESLLTSNVDNEIYKYIQLREWWQHKKSLTYPSEALCHYIQQNVSAFESQLMTSTHCVNLRALTITVFMTNSDSSFMKCEGHKNMVINSILTRLAILLIRRQCSRINKNISLDEENVKDIEKKSQQRGVNKDSF